MKTLVIENDLHPIPFYEYPISVDRMLAALVTEETVSHDLPYGTFFMKHWCFDGIRMGFTRHRYNDRFFFEKSNNPDVVSLEFNLKGSYTIHQQEHVYQVKSRQHNIVYSPGFHNTFRNCDLDTETFVVQFTPEVFLHIVEDSNQLLKKFADRMMEGKPAVLSQESLFINPGLQKIIQDVLNCRFTDGLKKMFLLSKSIEILVLQAEAYDKFLQGKNIYCMRKDDQDRIMFARDYLLEHADMPPNLSELSRKAGLNEYKLKRGFKEMFGNTVFGYLSDFRLDKSREALLDPHKPIAEIAYDLGYASPQHFSNAFKKRFGISPRNART